MIQLGASLQPFAYGEVLGFMFTGCTLRCSTGPLDPWTNPHETLRLTPLENLVPGSECGTHHFGKLLTTQRMWRPPFFYCTG